MFDLAVGGAMLIVLSPLFLSLALLILAVDGRPVLFRQRRPGRAGEPFTLLKFRTMSRDNDGAGQPLPDERRLTRLGKALRKASLDELPTLLNVIAGDMSLVGPRPLLVEYLPLYSSEQSRRHEVRPGITGWAQVNGRNAISWDEKFAYDIWYVDHWSLVLDLRILAMTVVNVACARGINQEGQATAERFRGSAP
jgi:lipopolysaccharide/colanic/teichoic acid biosynthesis glycosyltransferase